MSTRRIAKIFKSRPTIEGAGLRYRDRAGDAGYQRPGRGRILPPAAAWSYRLCLYPVRRGYFDDQRDAYAYEMVGHGWSDTERRCLCAAETVVLFEHAGSAVKVTTTDRPVRLLFVSGKPLGEPVAWYGPIVMNTQEELRIAFEEYQHGTFV